MRIVLLGPPGAGKGTIANILKEKKGSEHISTGDIFRDEMKNKTDLGKDIKKYIDSGALVPDEVVTKIIEKKLVSGKNLKSGYLLDGYPRTRVQAEDLDKILARTHQPIDYAIYMEASLPVILKRLMGRRVCRSCGALYHTRNKPPKKEGRCDSCNGELYQRADDNEETIKTRMGVYLENTKPIIDHYEEQGKLKKINADLGAESIEKFVMNLFDEK